MSNLDKSTAMRKMFLLRVLPMLMTGAMLFLTPTSADAQNRGTARRQNATTSQRRGTVRQTKLQRPAAPTPLHESGRTISDLLYFPYGCLPEEPANSDEARQMLSDTFGTCENINGSPGLHLSPSFDFSYRGVPIGTCFGDWMDNRQWFHFYLETKTEADRFYNLLTSDIIKAGIPLTRDRIYGGLSNRTHPVGIFKWVFVSQPVKVKEADSSNIETEDVVGMYLVEFGVYKRKVRQ